MTFRERLAMEHPEYVNRYFNGGCWGCPYGYGYERNSECFFDDGGDTDCAACWDREIPAQEKSDAVNHPYHYCREGGMESIDEMVLVFGKEAVMNFCLCNVWKYRYRAADKGGEEDLKKSDWYMRKYKELMEGER